MPAEVNDTRLTLVDRLKQIDRPHGPTRLKTNSVPMPRLSDHLTNRPDFLVQAKLLLIEGIGREEKNSDPFGQLL